MKYPQEPTLSGAPEHDGSQHGFSEKMRIKKIILLLSSNAPSYLEL